MASNPQLCIHNTHAHTTQNTTRTHAQHTHTTHTHIIHTQNTPHTEHNTHTHAHIHTHTTHNTTDNTRRTHTHNTHHTHTHTHTHTHREHHHRSYEIAFSRKNRSKNDTEIVIFVRKPESERPASRRKVLRKMCIACACVWGRGRGWLVALLNNVAGCLLGACPPLTQL